MAAAGAIDDDLIQGFPNATASFSPKLRVMATKRTHVKIICLHNGTKTNEAQEIVTIFLTVAVL